MLFVAKELAASNEVIQEQSLLALLNELSGRKLIAEELVKNQFVLFGLDESNIKEATERLELSHQNKWHTQCYSVVEQYMSKRINAPEARRHRGNIENELTPARSANNTDSPPDGSRLRASENLMAWAANSLWAGKVANLETSGLVTRKAHQRNRL